MKLTTANGVFLTLPHVVGFTTHPRLVLVEPSAPHLPPACSTTQTSCHRLSSWRSRPPRTTTRLGPLTAAATTVTQVTQASSLNVGSSCNRSGRRRPRRWADRLATTTSATTTTMALAASPTNLETSSRSGSTALDESNGRRSLRFAIVGVGAGELGERMGERYGLAVTSVDELMKGKKGRRTDNVKAKAVAKWLAEEGGSGAIITGFPTTVAEAKSLKKYGSGFRRLVVVHEPDTRCSEIADDVIAMYEDKVTEMYAREKEVPLLCDVASSLLGLAEHTEDDSVGNDGVATTAIPAIPSEAPGIAELAEVRVLQTTKVQKDSGVPIDDVSSDEAQAAEGVSASSCVLNASMLKRMSPSEHKSARKRHPVAYEAAVRVAKTGADAKRALKQILKEKKRAANDAQKLDTPFYLTVTSGKPKTKYHAPVSNVPSRITERLSSAVCIGAEKANTRLNFGPLVLDSPASDCLLAAGITKPTGIQMEAMGPILDGESVILHAMTGSGKTLTFLLPLMQRWRPSLPSTKHPGINAESDRSDWAFRVLIALPSRELAVQVAREAVLLAGGVTAAVELLVDSGTHHDLGKVTAPIVVGSAKILERVIRKSRPSVRDDVLSRVECIVVDEVDRLIDALPRHASPRDVDRRKRHARPISALLKRVIEAKPGVQVVACSATIGRPLRRELAHIVGSASAVDATFGSRIVDRHKEENVRGDLKVIRDPSATTSDENLAFERAVPIPGTIRHYCVPVQNGEFFSRLETLKEALRQLQPRRPLIFVPPEERVTAVVAHLRRAGGDIGRRTVALHEAMGFGSGSDDEDDEGDEGGRVSSVRGKHSSEAILRHDKLTGEFRDVAGTSSSDDSGRGPGGDNLLLRGIGRLGDGETGAILVTGEGSARGLHFDDIDFVFLMQRPKNPDEYVHLAGRTGRQGKAGNVVTLTSAEEFRKLQLWSSTLKVDFEKMNLLARK